MDAKQLPGVTAADEQFLAAFTAGRIANQDFHHSDHLRLAWIQIRRLGVDQASEAVTAAIRQFATRHGHADRIPRDDDALLAARRWNGHHPAPDAPLRRAARRRATSSRQEPAVPSLVARSDGER